MVKIISHRTVSKIKENRTTLKSKRISNGLLQGKVITNKPILRQSREDISNTKEYKDLMNLFK